MFEFLHQVVEDVGLVELFRLFYLAYVTVLFLFLIIILIYNLVEVPFFVQVHLDNETLIVFNHHGVQILLNKLCKMIVFLRLHNIVFHGFVLLLCQVLLVFSVYIDVARVVARFVHH